MRVALLSCVALIACGDARKSEPPPEPEPAKPVTPPPPACKNGEHVCVRDDIALCENGHVGRRLTSCRGGCRGGACVDTCGANDVELIYVVDGKETLYSFDPRKLPQDPFRAIGKLTCNPDSTPFSMAVDRTGIAWVLYQTGYLYQVSIFDAHCFSRSTKPQGAPQTFGMGFVTDGPKSTTEQLFGAANDDSQRLGTVDTGAPKTPFREAGKIRAGQNRNPELTGTSEGKLYGYFPGENTRGFVQEIDRTGKAVGTRWDLPADKGHVTAYAFAFFGDVFYVFATVDDVSEVHAIHRKTGKHEVVKTGLPFHIVGAGVSTCAPLLEKPA